MQPSDASAPIGGTATYTVQASGDATLTYQWRLNGINITGATTASYTTNALSLADALDKFSVVVMNSVGSSQSQSAGLTLGPRSPKPGDFRFKLVDLVTSTGAISRNNIDSGTSYNSGSMLGTPLSVGSAGTCAPAPGSCGWLFDLYNPPANITQTGAVYISGPISDFLSDLSKNAAPSNVLTAFDEQPASGVYAASYLVIGSGSNQPGGFGLTLGKGIALSDLQSSVTLAGQQSRVVTAIGYNPQTGTADYASYSWQSDITTQYETKIAISTTASVEADAADLAASGYIVTATGSGPNDGFILVGTRVSGDTLARPFSSVSYPNNALNAVAPLALIYDTNGNGYLAEE